MFISSDDAEFVEGEDKLYTGNYLTKMKFSYCNGEINIDDSDSTNIQPNEIIWYVD